MQSIFFAIIELKLLEISEKTLGILSSTSYTSRS